ncbi:MAG: hypothetical protein V4550_15900 [Gemmatimonadota bacterium]
MHASLPFFRPVRTISRLGLVALLTGASVLAPGTTQSQAPRPWLNWRTVETEHFVFHFPERYRTWTVALASRMEGVRTQVAGVVGFVPDGKVTVVVDDPSNEANGVAFTPLDEPTIVLWPTPPDPREDIGNFRSWGELLATHEFAHVAHLTRPSRNALQRLLWSVSPVPLGPIAIEAPRWVIEGYATYVEGRISGTGRPNHAWRAAVLRQFALEGRLPGYTQLSATGPWETGNFAYLAGSAFLEWLARRDGDSSVTALWRRMTAKTTRSFPEAFIGVFGDPPADLYGRFVAELTADAMAFERSFSRDALVSGRLVQRLYRNTGDPAISPDGRFVALTVRRAEAPSQVVVWLTADEPDTLSSRRREQQARRDPDDVPDRSFYPPPKRVIVALAAADGASYESPRWMPDNRHLLVTRRMPMADGSVVPDVFMWNAEDGSLARITVGAGLRDVDPSADGRWAAGVRCDSGWCDLVRLDLATGAVQTIIAGNLDRNFYRPRVSKRTGEIVVAEQSGDRWRIARVRSDDGSLRYADPDDGATRYDATYDIDGSTIITTSEAGGIANLERIGTNNLPTRLTSVTGAAVGGDVAGDGTLWFLSLHAGGYDLRRFRPDSESIRRVRMGMDPGHFALLDSLSAILPPRRSPNAADSSRRPAVAQVGEERPYGTGPDRIRYVPGVTSGYGGSNVQLAFLRTDPVGRLTGMLIGSVGAGALPGGLGFTVASRRSRNVLVAQGWVSHEAPSRAFGPALEYGLDLSRFGGALRIQRSNASDGGEIVTSLGTVLEHHEPSGAESFSRLATIGTLSIVTRQRDDDARYQQQLAVVAEAGWLDGQSYIRQRSALLLGVGPHSAPLTTLRVAVGTLGGSDGLVRERFAIGGFASPLIDPVLDGRRVDAPAYPVGSVTTTSFTSFRIALPYPPFELFYAGASPDFLRTSLRSYGLEFRERVPAVAALGTPDIDILTGFARAIDDPVAREWRYYVTLAIRP